MKKNKEVPFVQDPKSGVKRLYKRTYGMSKFTYRILWTLVWLIFIGGLCVWFNSGTPLWLLILWLYGLSV